MMFSPARSTLTGLATAVSLIALQTGTAWAFEPTGNAVADAFLEVLDAQEGVVEGYGNVSESGGAVTIENLVLTNEDDKDEKVSIASTVLTGGVILANGRLKLESLGVSALSLTADDGGMTLESLDVTDLVLPSPKEAAAKDKPANPGYRTFDVKNIKVTDEDGKVADIAAISSSIDAMDGDLPTAGRFAVTGATIDVNELEADETKTLRELGYDTLTMDIAASATWDPEAATIVIPDLKIDAKDAASLSLALTLGGVTRQVVEELEKKSQNPEDALALLQNVSIITAKIRLEDDTLTGRILDQEAKKAGLDTPTYVASLTGALPAMLGVLQNKDFEGQVAKSVSDFLTTPGSLEVAASPAAPVPFAQIMGTAMFAPQMIPQILSVGITANQ